ncbi:MAG: lipoyl(octanoyl) transferase LipB [Propionibacteriaceae bacterium]|nr:lipoyl(octanoyl) transferase LipB [Propionibacteriaceae bacterium]
MTRVLTFEYRGLGPERFLSDYQEAWEYQRTIHEAVVTGRRGGHVILLEHHPVYTAGRATLPLERPFDGTPVVDVDRGGKITWHGPGQLTGYPILPLPDGVGVVEPVRRFEAAVIDHLAGLGLDARRVEGRTGVWLPAANGRPERKICAIGIRVARRTTMHGFALNVLPNAGAFNNIIPCGISDAGVTSLAEELPGSWDVAQVAHDLEPHLRGHLEDMLEQVVSGR